MLNSVVQATDVEMRASDNFRLLGRLWCSPGAGWTQNVALINAGAGIRSGFYDRFAAFLAESGIPTLVYDYRGIGRSRPASLRGFKASVEEWGSKDCAAALSWLKDHFPDAHCMVVGHSIGGFVTGFAANASIIDRMLLVGAHTGYWGDYALKARFPMYLLWHALMPATTRVVGYFPGKRLGLLEDLPKGVALEWAGRRRPEFWWHLKQADGSFDSALAVALLARFSAIRARTIALRFVDDPFATVQATERILGLYKNVSAKRLVYSAADIGGQKIGHFAFFSSRFRATLWPRVLNAFLADD
jgi:predicted alpha/beta hydrolase